MDNYFVYVCNYNIYVFDISNTKKVNFIGNIKNDYNFNSSFTLDNKVFLQVCYNFHPEDALVKNAWALLNPKTLVIEKKKTLPDDDVIFGSFVNSWIDVQNSKIVYSRSSEYKITFHNESFEQIDSIVSNELDHNKKFVEQFKARDLFSKDALLKLRKEEDSLLTRIRKIYFLNDSCVLVLLKIAGMNELRADYWQKTENNWQIIKQDFSSLWYEEGKMYSNNDLTYTDFYQNIYGLNYIGNFHFILTYFPFITSINTESFDINKDFYDKQNRALKNNENYIGIKEIQINFPVY